MSINLKPNSHIPGQEELSETQEKIHTSQGLVLTGDKAEEFRKMALKVVEGNKEVIKILDDLEEEKERRLKLSIPKIPNYWKNKKELVDRYNIFTGLIIKNPVWWQEWKDKIRLLDDSVNILGNDWSLYTYFDRRENLRKLEKCLYLPSSNDFIQLHKFVYSLGRENFGTLAKFLGLREDEDVEYWTIDEPAVKLYANEYITYSFNKGQQVRLNTIKSQIHGLIDYLPF